MRVASCDGVLQIKTVLILFIASQALPKKRQETIHIYESNWPLALIQKALAAIEIIVL
jgi:hypothetical protein